MFKASGVITLTTDFGPQGPFVAVMKGRILGRLPEARIIDVTHEVPVYWPAEAGFWLARAYQYFPVGSVHVAVVDPGVGTGRDIIAVQADGHVFLAPDNGLLAPLLGRSEARSVHRLEATRLTQLLGLAPASATFHGRDIFAPVAAELAAGRLLPEQLGPRHDDTVPGWIEEPVLNGKQINGVVITIDHFGNLITNIDADLLSSLRQPLVRAAGQLLPLRRTYGDVAPGEFLALVNSFGVLEIACAERSAADSLGLGRGAPVSVVEMG